MRENKKFSVKLSVLMAVFIVISLSGCFSEWNGGDATLTLYLGGGADRGAFKPSEETLAQLSYVIELSGPSSTKVGPTEQGVSTFSISLFPGKWNITVTAYNDDGSVYAIGKTTVEARAGQNISKTITLNLVWEVFTDIEVFGAWLKRQPNNKETEPYHVKLNVNDLGGKSSTPGSLGYVLLEEGCDEKYVKLDLSGSTFISIENYTFQNCTSLIGITIPDCVTKITTGAFISCTNLTSVTFSTNASCISIGSQAFQYTSLTSVTIPDSVTEILMGAFSGCTSLTSVTIPASVTNIKDQAFSNCSSLTSVTFATGSNIEDKDFGQNVFPQGGINGDYGDNLKNAYYNANPKAGTYTREPGGSTWKHSGGGTLGKVWTAPTSPFNTYDQIQGIAYGNNMFVIGNSSGQMAYSSNGKTWILVVNSPFGSNSVQGIAYGGGKFVAVGGSGKIAHSSDGVNWTAVTNSPFGDVNNTIQGIAYGGGKFVAVGTYGKIAYSSDGGVTWKAGTISEFGEQPIYAIVFGNNKFVAVGPNGYTAYSSNGESWTFKNINVDNLNTIAYGGDKFVVVGNGGKIAYSSDGITWYSGNGLNSNFYAVAYGGGKFVAGNNNGDIYYSSDGITWGYVSNFDNTQSPTIYGIAYGGGKFVAVNGNGRIAWSE